MPDDFTHVPPEAAAALHPFLASVDRAYPGLVAAAWLEGSIALGDFHPRASDIDLVLVTSRAPPERPRPVRPIAMTWHTWDSLSTLATSSDLGAVSAATLHRYGIAVRGPKPATAVPDVERTTLANAMRSNLEAYWRPWLLRAKQGAAGRLLALHPRLIEWGTLGVPRQYVTIVEGDIASKSAAGRYVRERWEPRWHRIVDEALRLRTGSSGRRYLSPFERRRDMLAFVEHAIEVTHAVRS